MTFQDNSINNYFYDGQFKSHITQFMAIFAGLKVSVGKNDFDSETNLIEVPVVYGSRDRVVSHIFAENTQNKMLRLPIMSAQVIAIEPAADRRAGQGTERKEVKLKRGGMIPDDLQQVTTIKPVPYTVDMELAINTSNTDHHFQILEQIFLLFNPSLQIQVSDDYGNTSSIIEVFLQSINLEENYPAGNDNRIISSTLIFQYVMYLASPANLRNEIIKSIQIRLQNSYSTTSFNPDGIDPFIIDTTDAPTR